jgi:hypothetical protein
MTDILIAVIWILAIGGALCGVGAMAYATWAYCATHFTDIIEREAKVRAQEIFDEREKQRRGW